MIQQYSTGVYVLEGSPWGGTACVHCGPGREGGEELCECVCSPGCEEEWAVLPMLVIPKSSRTVVGSAVHLWEGGVRGGPV